MIQIQTLSRPGQYYPSKSQPIPFYVICPIVGSKTVQIFALSLDDDIDALTLISFVLRSQKYGLPATAHHHHYLVLSTLRFKANYASPYGVYSQPSWNTHSLDTAHVRPYL